ncbi:hypothetical protein B0O99DRAFT_686848 [Bisporella sp. PMI_857]|nr:hypothetical protein B0O99DRAFT_686848 [Bisporella sp. PMI_857]
MAAAGGTAIFVPIYIIPIFFQFTRNGTTLKSGVRILPFIVLVVFAVIGNGALLSTYGHYMPWYTLGGLLHLTGGTLMYTFGDGLFAQASFSVAQAMVDQQLIASAVGFITCIQVSGISIVLAIANAVFLHESQPQSRNFCLAIAGAGSAFVARLSDVAKMEVLKAIVTAMGKSYILVITTGAFAAVLSLGMTRERLYIAAGHAG